MIYLIVTHVWTTSFTRKKKKHQIIAIECEKDIYKMETIFFGKINLFGVAILFQDSIGIHFDFTLKKIKE